MPVMVPAASVFPPPRPVAVAVVLLVTVEDSALVLPPEDEPACAVSRPAMRSELAERSREQVTSWPLSVALAAGAGASEHSGP